VDFYLVRHGEAMSRVQDSERPLTPRGREAVEEVARLASVRNVQVSGICHSGILRAKQTAEILDSHLHSAMGVCPTSGLLPEDDPMIAKTELETAQQSILLVGHLPHMKRLAALLATGNPDREVVANFAPATMICFSYDHFHWRISWILAARAP
jgi:phosphohistidine phosphatase